MPTLLSRLYRRVQEEDLIEAFHRANQNGENTQVVKEDQGSHANDAAFMAEYIFRASITPWMARLTSSLFCRELESERQYLTTEELSSDFQIPPYDGPDFLDTAIRVGISRAVWTMRILRFAPQDK